jgi:hypothetical protein
MRRTRSLGAPDDFQPHWISNSDPGYKESLSFLNPFFTSSLLSYHFFLIIGFAMAHPLTRTMHGDT